MLTRNKLAFVLLSLTLASTAQAHFTWLSSDDEGRALLFFGETPKEMNYKLPAPLAKAKVFYQAAGEEPQEVAISKVEEDDFIGLRSEPKTVDTGVLTSYCTYGNYHGTLLTYYVKHYTGDLAQSVPAEVKAAPEGFVIDARPSLIDRGIALTVTRDGKPVEGATATVIDPSGETSEKTTDGEGVAKFYNIEKGEIGFIVRVIDKAEGEVDGEKYTSASHYVTIIANTADAKQQAEAKASASKAEPDAAESQSAVPSAIAPLPLGLASFGAAVLDDYAYAYSGHIGPPHHHSKSHYSTRFYRAPLSGGEWEELPMQCPLQGLVMLPYNGKLYRIGGMYSHNNESEDDDMQSVDYVAAFDPAANEWHSLPPLPEPRSSHDAVVVDGVLYVIGGWTLTGNEDGEWLETAWKLDLDQPKEGWKPVPQPPTTRRALAVSSFGNNVVAMGGMDEFGDITRKVEALDISTGEWRELPELPGNGMQGFGASAWNHEGHLYVSGSSGIVYTLSDDMSEWREVARHADKRFLHRLLPAGKNRLLMLGGASLKTQQYTTDSEWVELEVK